MPSCISPEVNEQLTCATRAAVATVPPVTWHEAATAGVAVAPMHADTAVALLARADEALRAAKRAGRESLCVFGRLEPVQRRRDSVGTTLDLEGTWPPLEEVG